jgi:hypothetical protein
MVAMATTPALGRRKAPKPTADCTAFYDDGQGKDESEDDDDHDDPDDDVPEEVTATATGADPTTKKKKISKSTAGYTPKEDVCLCRSWLAISQDAISSAEQKGRAYWKRGDSRLP